MKLVFVDGADGDDGVYRSTEIIEVDWLWITPHFSGAPKSADPVLKQDFVWGVVIFFWEKGLTGRMLETGQTNWMECPNDI